MTRFQTPLSKMYWGFGPFSGSYMPETEPIFNFDLDEMKKAMESPMIPLPDCIEDEEEFYKWLEENF